MLDDGRLSFVLTFKIYANNDHLKKGVRIWRKSYLSHMLSPAALLSPMGAALGPLLRYSEHV